MSQELVPPDPRPPARTVLEVRTPAGRPPRPTVAAVPAPAASGAGPAMEPPPITLWTRVRQVLPEGRELAPATWRWRHNTILVVLAFHAVGLAAFGLWRGWGLPLSIGEGALIGALTLVAWWPRLSRRFRSATAALAAVTSSAVLTQFSGGYIEAHFHFFVMVALIAMYQDWVPFLLAIVYVAVDHGVVGTLLPTWVYNHPDAVAHPWKWAGIHAALVLAECAALLAFWGGAEKATTRSDLVLEAAGEGVVGLDRNRRITFANPTAAAIFGARGDDLVGRRIDDMVADDKGAPLALPWVAGAARPLPTEGTARGPKGVIPVEWTARPIERARSPVGHVLTLRDVTERKRAQQALERSNKDLQQFAYVASHDLQEPLRMVSSYVKMIGSRYKGRLDADADDFIGFAVDGATRMQALIDDLLQFSRVSRVARPPQAVDMKGVLGEVSKNLEVALQQAEARLVVGDLPVVRGDRTQLVQLFQNLVANAVKFRGPAPPVVEVKARRDGDAWRFTVSDNGIGIDPADRGRLFQIFQRLHRDEYPGTGIGLAICKAIAERHGGRIWVESERGQGAQFHVTFPDGGADA